MSDIRTKLLNILSLQKNSFHREGKPDIKTRKDRLDRLINMLLKHEDEIVEFERMDFLEKSPALIRLAEIMGTVNAIRYTKSKMQEWMKPERIEMPAEFEAIGIKAEIQFQALGTVGVVSPWNGPIILTCMPLAGILAAGNRAMIKPSELAPNSAELLSRMIKTSFDESEIAVITGGIDVGSEFIKLPFDHLLYTGSTRVAKIVMKAAAENLVPVTLELGGKCPVIIGRDADIPVTAQRLAYGKLLHAGQVCVTPDYLFVPEENMELITTSLVNATEKIYPTVMSNEDYSPIINEHHFHRLQMLVDDAKDKGAEVIIVNPGKETINPEISLKFPLHIVLHVTDEMRVMHEEIFGPILPIKTYQSINEVIEYVRAQPNPLSAYYFGHDADDQQILCDNISTGSIVINDVVCQIFHEQIPFGGVGSSGMGRYRGQQGFKTFSNQMSVLSQTNNDGILAPLRPPYGKNIDTFINQQLSGQAN